MATNAAGGEDAKHTTKSTVAFRQLRAAIEAGDLQPGERLIPEMLRQELQMSATPVREALRMLEAEGLVEHHPHHGAIVAKYSLAQAAEVYQLRQLLEPTAVELAVQRATDEDLAEIQLAHDRLEAALANSDPVDWYRLNAAWHLRLCEAARSPILVGFIQRLWTGPFPSIAIRLRAVPSSGEHDAIMEAVNERDHVQAGKLMRAHLEHATSIVMKHLHAIHAPLA